MKLQGLKKLRSYGYFVLSVLIVDSLTRRHQPKLNPPLTSHIKNVCVNKVLQNKIILIWYLTTNKDLFLLLTVWNQHPCPKPPLNMNIYAHTNVHFHNGPYSFRFLFPYYMLKPS